MDETVVGYELFVISFIVAILFSSFIFAEYFIGFICIYIGYKTIRPVAEKLLFSAIKPQGRGVFITGCDSGFGYKLAEYLDDVGFVVFAGCLDESSEGAKRLQNVGSRRMTVLELDVTNQRSVENAACFVQNHLPRQGLWAIVNNAGINSIGDIELTPVETYEISLEVNMYGPIRVCKLFLPLIRQSKGRIVNVASVHGRLWFPRNAIYEVTKHGLETVSDSLRLEMKKFGVKVSIIEPGAFRTSGGSEPHVKRMIKDIENMWEKASEKVREAYKLDDLLSFVIKPSEFRWPPGKELMPVVKAMEHAIRSPFPNDRYLVCGRAIRIRFVDEFVMLPGNLYWRHNNGDLFLGLNLVIQRSKSEAFYRRDRRANLLLQSPVIKVVAKLCKLLPTWIVDEYIARWRVARKFRNS